MTHEPVGQLSAREREILEHVATGATNQQIAYALHISANTVKVHLRNVFAKLQVESRTEATRYAIQHGLVAVDGLTADDARSAGAVDGTGSDAGTEDLPVRVSWPPARGQAISLVIAMALVALALVWPGPRTTRATPSPLSDRPEGGDQQLSVTTSTRWTSKAQMPVPRARFAQAVAGETVYAISGQTDEGVTTRTDAYLPLQDVWGHAAAKPTAVSSIGAATVGGLVYVPGGLDGAGAVRDILEVYDPSLDAWAARQPMPVPLCGYAIAAAGEGLYVLGGWDGAAYQDRTWYYDVGTDAWRETERLGSARAFAAAASADGRVYVVGGYDGAREVADCQVHDISSDDVGWRTCAPMEQARAGHAMVAIQGSLYVVGGGWTEPISFNERYDVTSNTWSTFESPLRGQWRSLGASAVESSRGTFVYAMGGWGGQYLSSVRVYQALFRVYVP